MKVPHQRDARPPLSVWMALSVVIFFLALAAADSIGFVPYYIDGTAPASARAARSSDAGVTALTELSQLRDNSLVLDTRGRLRTNVTPTATTDGTQLPVHMTISAIGLDLRVQNPATIDVAQLDALLTNGPARYRNSAALGEDGNVIIFAHSSHLPVVHNQMYKAFNRIPELVAGDLITLTGDAGTTYLYRVTRVQRVDVNDDVELSLARDGKKLTLVTCDTLTGKSARYVLEATFIGTAS